MKILHVFTIPNTAKTFFDGQFNYLSQNHLIHFVAQDGNCQEFCKKIM